VPGRGRRRIATLPFQDADATRREARASRIVEAYRHVTGVQARGAVMFGDEMIDEASHKMARAIVARGRASGLGHDNPGDDAGIGSGNT
jgi:hypothetical protein